MLYWDVIYYSDRDVPENYQQDSAVQQTANAYHFYLSNLHLTANINKSLELGFGINHIFDGEYLFAFSRSRQ
ncbi:MAG: hypothetical protein HRU20_28480 [Pseudomonadales bacterium]|nr:hypothetical protein [Pseudomonadales bacterium]